FVCSCYPCDLHPFPTRRSSDLFAFAQAAFAAGQRDDAAETLLTMIQRDPEWNEGAAKAKLLQIFEAIGLEDPWVAAQRRRLSLRSEEHTSELQSRENLVCRLLL